MHVNNLLDSPAYSKVNHILLTFIVWTKVSEIHLGSMEHWTQYSHKRDGGAENWTSSAEAKNGRGSLSKRVISLVSKIAWARGKRNILRSVSQLM